MPAETLLTAARRMVRFIRIDDAKEGGLLSIDTIKANETLALQVEQETRAISRVSTIVEISQSEDDFWIRFEGSTEAVCVGPTCQFWVGDSAEISIRKVG